MQGIVLEVNSVASGNELEVDHPAGATVLQLVDAEQFLASEGGSLEIDGRIYNFLSADETARTVTLETPLTAAAEYNERVNLFPPVIEKWAKVEVEEDSDVKLALVGQDLYDRIPEGVREVWEQEQVVLEIEDGDLKIANVIGSEPSVSGAFIDPETLPERTPVEAPTVSPVITTTGMPNSILVRAENIDPTSEIQYHMSTDPLFVPGPTTASGPPTRSTVYIVSELPDGTPLKEGSLYYFRAVAQNALGAAEPSPVVEGSLNLEAVKSVVAQEVVAGFILTGMIQIGMITIDANDGIKIPQSDGSMTQLRADGGGNTFAGQAILDALDVLGNLNIRGLYNFVNGLVTLGNGVGNPRQQLDVTVSWASTKWTNAGYNRRGLADNPSLSADLWWTTDTVGTLASNVQAWVKSTGAAYAGFDVLDGWLALGGLTIVGDRIYVLCAQRTADKTTWVRDNWRVLIYDLLGPNTYRGSFQALTVATSGSTYPSLGTDGTNLVMAWVGSASELRFRTFDTAGTQIGATLNGGVWGGSTSVMAVAKTSQGFSADRYVVTSPTSIFTHDMTGARVSADTWPPAGSNIRGLVHSTQDNRWHSFHSGDRVYDYTRNSGKWDFSYTWVDNDPAGLGVAESLPAPARIATPTKYARWTLKIPVSPPDDGTTDGANTAALYAAPNGSPLIKQSQLPEGTLQTTFSSLATAGTPAPTVSGFATRLSTALGRIASSASDALGPYINLGGDGVGRAGPWRWDQGVGRGAMALRSNTTQSIGDSAWVAVNFQETRYNTGGYTPSPNYITIEETGYYCVSANVAFGVVAAATRRAVVIENYTTEAAGSGERIVREEGVSGPSATPSFSCSTDAKLVAGTKIRVSVYQSSGGALLINGVQDARLTIHRIA